MVEYNNTPCFLNLVDVVVVFLLLAINGFHIFF